MLVSRSLLAVLVATGLFVPLADAQKAPAARVQNPIMDAADPHAMVVGDTVWLYPTRSFRGANFFAWSSKDLITWKRSPQPILDFKDSKWVYSDGVPQHGAWAPAMIEKGGRYYFYYSVGDQNKTPSRIGVAVGRGPGTPFKDSGKPLLTGGNGFEAIDPMVFLDPKSKKYYLYAGGSAGAKLRVFELDDDMIGFKKEIEVETPEKFTEGSFIHFHAGKYHFTYSHGGWQDASYSLHYATSDTPVGPWKYVGPILESNAAHKGPGHHSIIHNPRSDKWYVVYHRWNNRDGDGPYKGSRAIAIDELTYDDAGLIKPITMTDTGPAADRFGAAKR